MQIYEVIFAFKACIFCLSLGNFGNIQGEFDATHECV